MYEIKRTTAKRGGVFKRPGCAGRKDGRLVWRAYSTPGVAGKPPDGNGLFAW